MARPPMTPKERLARLDKIAARLPFAVEDYAAVNRAFERWAAGRADEDLEVIDVWSYCFTQRYCLVRFVRETGASTGSDLDGLISTTFLHVRTNLERVTQPSLFTHWVSVVCRNAYANYRRSAGRTAPLDEERAAAEPAPEGEGADLDRPLLRRTLHEAVGRLPSAVRAVAAPRLLEGRSYDHIAATTGHPVATVRAYVCKAMSRLRRDPALRALYADWQGGDLATASAP